MLLFLGAMFVPCCVLVVLSVSILRQERELAERRRDAEANVPSSDKSRRVSLVTRPVIIEDDERGA